MSLQKKLIIILLSMHGIFVLCGRGYSQRIFWTERNAGRIQVGQLSPTGISGVTPFVSGLNNPADLSLDPAKNFIFYTEQGGEDLMRRNFDGSSPILLRGFGAFTGFNDIAYSSNANGVFGALYPDEGGANYVPEDGSPETGLPLGSQGNDDYNAVAAEDGNEYVYLLSYSDDAIYRTDFSGSSVLAIGGGVSGKELVAADPYSATVYFTRVNLGINDLYRCNSDGSGLTMIATLGNGYITSLYCYAQFGKIYFVMDGTIYMIDDLVGASPVALFSGSANGLEDIAIEADFDAPVFITLNPADNTSTVNPTTTTTIAITFNEPIKKQTTAAPAGTDEIVIEENGVTFSTINRTSSNISISGNVATITLPIPLNQLADYDVLIRARVFEDMSGNDFTGISLPTGWNFSTICVSFSVGAATGDQSVCIGGDPTLITAGTPTGGDGTYGYQWEESTTSSTGPFTPVSVGGNGPTYDPPAGIAGTTYYRVQVFSATCTTQISNVITVTTVPLPVLVSSSTPQAACDGTPATFAISATGVGLTYQWQEDAGSGFADVANGGVYSGALSNTLQISNTTGKNGYSYRCVVSSGSVCSVTSTPSALTVNPLPTVVNQTPAAVCESVAGSGNATYDLTSLNALISGGQANRAIGWFTNAGLSSPVASPTNATINTGQIYYAEVRNTVTGCSASGTATFTVNSLPTAIANPANTTICSGAATAISLTGTGSPTFNWTVVASAGVTGASAGSGTTISQTLTNTTTSSQTVTYTITPSNGCTGTPATAVVSVDPQPTVFTVGGGGEFCTGSGSGVVVSLSNSQAGITYELLLNGGATGISASPGGGVVNFTPVTAAGTYTVRARTANNCLNAMTGSAVVTVNSIPPAPGPISGPASVCAGNQPTYSVTGATQDFVWTFPAGFSPTGSTSGSQVTVDVTGGSGGQISVSRQNTCGTSSASTLAVSILPAPQVTIELPDEAFAEDEVQLSFSADVAISSQSWSFGNGDQSTDANPTVTYASEGSYTISIAVKSDQGCDGEADAVLKVNPKALLTDFSIKNVVTANGDEKNAFLYIERIEKFPDNEVVLLDRWGVEIFRRKGYNNDWDLVVDGDYIPAGNYVCIVKENESGKVYSRTITVIRGQ